MEDRILPSELLRALRESLKATVFTTDDDRTFDPRSPALRKLVEAVLFSRKFVVTYYAVLAASLLAVGLLRWTKRLLPSRRASQSQSHTPASFESSSSTLRGDASSDDVEDFERRPLLGKYEDTHVRRRTLFLRLVSWANAARIYQPRPIPAVTAPANVLPANGTSAAIGLFIGVNIFYLLFHTTLSVPMLFAFADRAGLCFVMNLPVLYLLGAKSNQPVQFLTGWTYEGLNIFHRRLGEWMIALAAMHSFGMLGVWYTLLRPLHFPLSRFITGRVGLLGMFTFVSYLAIYISSIGWIRRLFYERFLVLHIVLQVTALIFLFFHHRNSRPYVLASFGIWALDRIVVRTCLSSQKSIATLEVAADQETVLLYCDIPIRARRWLSKVTIREGWLPSQHVFVTVPGMGYAKHRLQAHPFTIASPAPPVSHTGPWTLQLTIRAQDGFSRELLEYAKFHQHTEVLLDGPYGSTETLDATKKADRVCLVAGGSGIAVTYPLAWSLHVESWADSLLNRRTIYANGQLVKSSITSFRPLNSKHSHIWVRQDAGSDEWLTTFPRYDTIRGQSRMPMTSARNVEADGKVAADLVDAKFETGGVHGHRPDLRSELRAWVEDVSPTLLQTDTPTTKREKLVVVCSGPESLVRDVRNSVASLVHWGWNIDVHVEKFGW